MSAFNVEHVDVEDFLECLEIRNITRATADEIRFSCPFPNHTNGDDTASAYMNLDTTAFFCHGCKERGTAISFAAQALGISPIEAIRMLKQRYQPGYLNPDAVSMVEEVRKIFAQEEEISPRQPEVPESEIERMAVDWGDAERSYIIHEGHPATDYMFDRGFLPDTLASWEIGYDPITNRISLPVRDLAGQLIGFKARAYDDRQPKYLVLGDKPNRDPRRYHYGYGCYFPSRVVFGAHRVKEGGEVVICEGELNAIAVNARTGRDAVAINGSYFSQDHARIIRKIAEKVILFLDDDPAGQAAVWGWRDANGNYHPGIVDQLRHFVPVLIVDEHEEDAAELNGSQINDLIEGAAPALLRSLARAKI